MTLERMLLELQAHVEQLGEELQDPQPDRARLQDIRVELRVIQRKLLEWLELTG